MKKPGEKLSRFWLLCDGSEVAHEDGGNLFPGGVTLGQEMAVAAVDQARCHGPAQGIGGVGGDLAVIGECTQIGTGIGIHAQRGGIAHEDGGNLLSGDAGIRGEGAVAR